MSAVSKGEPVVNRDGQIIGYWINTEDTGLYMPPRPAAPERPAPAGWDTLENVR